MRTLTALLVAGVCFAAEPLRLHPDNPHYFLFRGKPTVLVTSGEHYGALINRDFDYVKYFDELKRRNLNHTRIWAGAYREVPGNFAITRNTLAPELDRFLPPWPRKGDRFDLEAWNPEYFTRLRSLMREASKRGIVIEMNLFCPMYEDSMWEVSPLNAKNNVNGVGAVPRTEALTLKHPGLVKAQEAMVRKLVAELREFDNLFYEIANEPYFGGVTLEWQEHIARVIHEAESGFPHRHLISQNIANGSTKIEKPFEAVSIFNFHYSRPPESVAMNYGLMRAIGNNETGFDGSADSTYRVQGWDFLIAGGALYNNLDYSFVAGHEGGDFAYPEKTPGGGSMALRNQLGFLHRFFNEMPFVRMKPANEVIRGGVPEGGSARVLAEAGRVYTLYLHHGREVKDGKPKYQVAPGEQRVTLSLDLPAGKYRGTWYEPASGRVLSRVPVAHAGGLVKFESPVYREDVVLRLVR